MTNDKFTKEGHSRFTLRIPEELLNKVKRAAEESKRSTGKQIEYILEEFFSKDKDK